jgi:hypothetical protein
MKTERLPNLRSKAPDLPIRVVCYSGPPRIAQLYGKDPRFAEFIREFDAPIVEGLRGAAVSAIAYIEACGSSLGREIDPEHCSTVGGHIHMATITKGKGFEWIEGFEPVPCS